MNESDNIFEMAGDIGHFEGGPDFLLNGIYTMHDLKGLLDFRQPTLVNTEIN